MCRALDVSRSGYYAFKKRPKSRGRVENEKLLIEIRRVFLDNNSNYGSPRVWNQLNNVELIRCSENRVARVMQRAGIITIQKRKFRLTTNSKHDYPVWPNILNRNFVADKPNAVWVSDITYIWTFEGWLYLAAVLDLFSRVIVGLAMDKTIAVTHFLKWFQMIIPSNLVRIDLKIPSTKDLFLFKALEPCVKRFKYVLETGATCVIIGEIGSGKSATLWLCASKLHPAKHRTIALIAHCGSWNEMLRQTILSFGAECRTNSMATMIKMAPGSGSKEADPGSAGR